MTDAREEFHRIQAAVKIQQWWKMQHNRNLFSVLKLAICRAVRLLWSGFPLPRIETNRQAVGEMQAS
jgi:hypothetical protein